MKRPIAFLCIFGLMLALTACSPLSGFSSSQEPAPIAQEPSGSSSSSEEAMPQPQPPAPTDPETLAVSARIFGLMPKDELKVSATKWQPEAQAQLDILRQKLLTLDPGSLTKLYADSTTDFAGEMALSKEDTALLLDKLKHLEAQPVVGELGNPPTGGGWDCYLETGDDAFLVSYNGAWLTFAQTGDDTTHIFLCDDDQGIDTFLWEKQTAEMQKVEPTRLTYQGRSIAQLYALHKANYTTHLVSPPYAAEILKGLESYTPATPELSDFGYILVWYDSDGKEQKEYLYIGNDDASTAYLKECLAVTANAPANIHWFTHFSPDKLTKAVFSGYDSSLTHPIGVTTSDPKMLHKIADFLKNDLVVKNTRKVVQGPVNLNMPLGLYTLELTFNTGVRYFVHGYDEDIWIYASDLDKTIGYTCDKAVIDSLRDLMERY